MWTVFQVAFGFFKAFLKVLGKLTVFCGLYWFGIPVVVGVIYELITGGSAWDDPVIGVFCNYILWYIAFVLVFLTTAQSILRMIKKDASFNIYKTIYRKIIGCKDKIGTQAKVTSGNAVEGTNVHGVVFGKLSGKYYIKDENEKACSLIIGGTRSGKTSGIAIPTLKKWRGKFFAIDIKGELFEKTAADREMVKKFDPFDREACHYDPFYSLRYARNPSQEVKNIALAIIPPTNVGNEKFWVESAQDFLSGSILFFQGFGMNFAETMMEIKSHPARETVALVMESDDSKAKAKMAQFDGMDEKTLGGIFAEVSRNIDVFATDDDLIRVLNDSGECITPQDLEDGYDIYCCIPEHVLEQWRPLMTMMCNQFFKFFEQRSLDNEKPILFLMDEFPRLGRIESVMGGLSTLAGRNVNLALIIQSKAQLNAVYGADNANIITDNCGYKAILKASEPETQKWCAELVGKYEKEKHSSNYSADIIGIGKGSGAGKTTEQRYIIEPNEFGYLAENGKLILIAPSGYKKLDKIKWWEEKAFMERKEKILC